MDEHLKLGRKERRIVRLRSITFASGLVAVVAVGVVAAVTVYGTSPGERIGRSVARLGSRANTPVVVVNGEPITLAEIEATKEALMTLPGYDNEREAYKEALRSQVRSRVLLQKAKASGIVVSDEEVDRAIESLPEETRDSLEQQLKVRGQSTDLKTNRDIRSLIWSSLMKSKFEERLKEAGKSPEERDRMIQMWVREANLTLHTAQLPKIAQSISIDELR